MSLTLAFAQVVPANRVTLADEAAKRIADLNRSFAGIAANTPVERELIAACSVDCSRPEVKVGLQEMQARLAATMDSVTTQMHVEVDLYLTRTTDPMNRDLNCRAVQKELARILAPATDTPPSVFLLDSPGSRALIVAYALHKGEQMGRDSTSATVRAYRADKGRVRLIDSVGRDMDDYDSLSFQQLHSPTPSEAWLIARGQATGANGPNVRMHLCLRWSEISNRVDASQCLGSFLYSSDQTRVQRTGELLPGKLEPAQHLFVSSRWSLLSA